MYLFIYFRIRIRVLYLWDLMCPSTHKVHAHEHIDKAWKEEEGYDICLLNRIEACQPRHQVMWAGTDTVGL